MRKHLRETRNYRSNAAFRHYKVELDKLKEHIKMQRNKGKINVSYKLKHLREENTAEPTIKICAFLS